MRVNVWVPSELKWRKEETTWGGKKYKFPRKCMPAGVLAIHQYVCNYCNGESRWMHLLLSTHRLSIAIKSPHTLKRDSAAPSAFFFNPTLLSVSVFLSLMAKFWLCFLCVLLVGRLVSGQDDDQFSPGGSKREMVPAMFIFGDSLIDNGNNNNLPSFAKANYFPYGIDFEGGPTGRFSNGYTMVDEIGGNSLCLSLYLSIYLSIHIYLSLSLYIYIEGTK